MSIINSILKILNMKDPNLIFNENFIEEREIKNKRCLVFLGYLKNNFDTLQIPGQHPGICYLLINLLFFFIDVMKSSL